MSQKSLFDSPYLNNVELRRLSQEYDNYTRTRLSKNFILRDFLYSSDSDFRGIRNSPQDREMVLRSARKLTSEILEPITERFGKIHITFAYQANNYQPRQWL